MYGINNDEEEFSRYQQAYVEAYLDNRIHSSQSIEEWTQEEGKLHFPASDIYAPVEVAVAISGSELNGFSIDLTRPDWHNQFQAAVKQSLLDAGLARAGDAFGLTDVRGNSIADKTQHEIQQTGVIYATVNGKRTIDMPASSAVIGCAVETPATHAINKEELLHNYVEDTLHTASAIIIDSLCKAGSVVDVENQISVEGHKANLLPVLTNVIMKSGTAKQGTLAFAKVVETYADPAVLMAIQDGRLSYEDIATDMANNVLDNVAAAMQVHNEELDAFYQHQAIASSTAISSSIAASSPQGRSIFGGTASAKRIQAIATEYPTARRLHGSIVQGALLGNAALGDRVKIVVKRGPVYFYTASSRRVHKKKGSRHLHHHQHHHTGQVSNYYDKHGKFHPHHKGGKKSHYHQYPTTDDYHKSYFHGDRERYMHSLHCAHKRAGLPPHPGSLTAVVSNYKGSGKKSVPGSWHGEYMDIHGPASPSLSLRDESPAKSGPRGTSMSDVSKRNVAPGIAAEMYNGEPPSAEPIERHAHPYLFGHPDFKLDVDEVPSLEQMDKDEVPSLEPVWESRRVNAPAPAATGKEQQQQPPPPLIQPQKRATMTTEQKKSVRDEVPSLEAVPVRASLQTSFSRAARHQEPIASAVPTVIAATGSDSLGLPSFDALFSSGILNGPIRKK